jgi:hypothetical protein
MKKMLSIFLAIFSAAQLCVWSQEPEQQAPTGGSTARDVLVIKLVVSCKPAEYAVRMSSIQSITLQNYDMRKEETVRKVVELTIETSGGNKNRFFWEGEPKPLIEFSPEVEDLKNEIKDTVQDLVGANDNFQGSACRVLKDYPVTTHGNWTEFKLKEEDDVRKLHKKLMEAWTGGKSCSKQP